MWHRSYQDYPEDKPLRKNHVESGRGIIGCEMDEINGYGLTIPKRKLKPHKKGLLVSIFSILFGSTFSKKGKK